MKLLISLIAVLSSCQIVFAADSTLSIKDAWARPVILQGRPGAAYLTIQNHSDMADSLTKVTSTMAERVELHVHKHVDGIMKMQHVLNIPVAAHSKTVIQPGGYHLMLFGLNKKLAVGDDLPLTLTFTHAGEVKVTAKVMKKAPKMDHSMMDHGTMKHN